MRFRKEKEYKYLGFTLQKNGGIKAQLKKRVKKAGSVMREKYGAQEKGGLGREVKRRLWLFEVLV